jgi:hypothetical protein
MGKITEITVTKGRSVNVKTKEEWKSAEYTFKATITDAEEAPIAIIELERLADERLAKLTLAPQAKAQPEVLHIPQFNSEELLEHEWKGRKTGEGQYSKGSVSFGWDFRDEFNEEVIKTLEKGPITIDQYQFTLAERIVQAKKKKN